jgi:hypothetical protein
MSNYEANQERRLNTDQSKSISGEFLLWALEPSHAPAPKHPIWLEFFKKEIAI